MVAHELSRSQLWAWRIPHLTTACKSRTHSAAACQILTPPPSPPCLWLHLPFLRAYGSRDIEISSCKPGNRLVVPAAKCPSHAETATRGFRAACVGVADSVVVPFLDSVLLPGCVRPFVVVVDRLPRQKRQLETTAATGHHKLVGPCWHNNNNPSHTRGSQHTAT